MTLNYLNENRSGKTLNYVFGIFIIPKVPDSLTYDRLFTLNK